MSTQDEQSVRRRVLSVAGGSDEDMCNSLRTIRSASCPEIPERDDPFAMNQIPTLDLEVLGEKLGEYIQENGSGYTPTVSDDSSTWSCCSSSASPLTSPQITERTPGSPLFTDVFTRYFNVHMELVKRHIKQSQSETTEKIQESTAHIEVTRKVLGSRLERSLSKVDATVGNQQSILRELKRVSERLEVLTDTQHEIEARMLRMDHSMSMLFNTMNKQVSALNEQFSTMNNQLSELSLRMLRSQNKLAKHMKTLNVLSEPGRQQTRGGSCIVSSKKK